MSIFFFHDEKITALTLANYVLKKAQERGVSVTNFKLQKILYYVQGYYMARFNHPLFPDEMQAWKFGPVIPNVYYSFSGYGSDPLQILEDPDMDNCSESELALIDRIIDEKLSLSAKDMIESSCNERPWLKATDNGKNIRFCPVIDNEAVSSFFAQQS